MTSSTHNENAQNRAVRTDLSEAGSVNQSRRTPSTDNEIVHHMNRSNIEKGDTPANRQSSSSTSSSAAPADQQLSSAQSSAPDVSHQSSSSSSGAVRPQSARTVRTSDAAAIDCGPLYIACSWLSPIRCTSRM